MLDKASIAPNVQSTVDSPIAASIDFKSMIGQGIYENVNLKEALSKEDQMKLQSLLNKLKKDYPDLANQNQKMFTQAQKIIKTGKLDAPTPKPRGGRGSGKSELELRKAANQSNKTTTTTKTSSTNSKTVSGGGSTTRTVGGGKVTTTKTAPKQQGTTTTSTKGTLKGVTITPEIRKTKEWLQFYKKPVAPKRSLETEARKKADLKYKQAIAQGKIKPPAGASVDSKTTTKNPDGSTTTTTVGKGQNSPTVKSVRDEFAKMDREAASQAKPGGKTYMSKKGIQTDF